MNVTTQAIQIFAKENIDGARHLELIACKLELERLLIEAEKGQLEFKRLSEEYEKLKTNGQNLTG